MDLKTKLAFALVSAALLSMAALGSFTYLWAAETFLADSGRQLAAVAESRKAALDATFVAWQAEAEDLVARAESASAGPDAPILDGATFVERSARLLREAAAASQSLLRVTLFDLRGDPLLGSSGADPALPAALPASGVVSSGVQVEPDGRIGAVFHGWLGLAGQRVGVVEVVFDASAIARSLGPGGDVGESAETSLLAPLRRKDAAKTAAGGYLLMGSSGRSVEVAASAAAASGSVAAAAVRGGEQVWSELVDDRGREVMAATVRLAAPDWRLAVQVDRAEARQRSDRLLTDMRDLGVALAAFAVLGGTLLGLHLGRPIHQLVEQVDRIRHGELGLRLAVEGEDEVAFLAQALNEFMDQLDRSSDLFRLGELSVLVVDPGEQSRRLLRDLLVNWNMRPTLVETPAAALDAFQRANRAEEPLQLVLLDDEALADTDALRLADRLRSASSRSLPIILLASKVDAFDAGRLEEAGIGCVLPKPVIASHLMEAILDEMGVSAEGLEATLDTYIRKTQPRRILLVEDNALMQRVMIQFLENWGHEVTLVENGRLAVEATGRERFDLILIDVEMPVMNGLDATVAIRSQEREGATRTPIIALTAEARKGDRERCLAAGMDDYLSKPVDPKALYAVIERVPAGLLAAPTSAEALPPVVDPGTEEEGQVDWELARSYTGGDEGLLDSLIEIFEQESELQLQAMRSAFESGDAELLTRSAHTLKGAALVFGASKVSEAALAIESLAALPSSDRARQLLETLESETGRLNAELVRHLAGRVGAAEARSDPAQA